MSKMRWLKAVSSCLILLCAPGQAWAQPGTGALDSLVATITESHGTVYKRGFVDWKKAEWTDPEPAKLGDALSEGMQLGTKADSWAQVSWPNVIARAWENSVFAVAPNKRLVYLCQGEMLLRLDKHRKDKNNYYIWTKTMQARIHGTTVLVRATPEISEITVLEGSVVLLNRINHSIVNLNPGVVFQINNQTGQAVFPPNTGSTAQPGASPAIAPTSQSAPQVPAQNPTANDHPAGAHAPDQSNTASPSAAPRSTGKDTGQLHLTDISSNHKPMELFKTEAETSSVKHVSSEKILSHPLVSQFENKLDSIPLIKDAMSKLPAECRTDGAPIATTNGANNSSGIANNSNVSNTSLGAPIQGANNAGDNSNQVTSTANGHSLQATGFQITQVPTSTKYEIGSGALQQLSLPPGCLREFPPSGLIAAGTNSANTAFQQTDKSTSQSLNNVATQTLGAYNLNNTASSNLGNSAAASSQALNNVVTQNLSGLATANVASTVNQNLSAINTQNLTGFAALNLNNTLTQNLAAGLTQTLTGLNTVNLVNTTSANSAASDSINCMNSCPNLVTAIDSCQLNTNVCADAGP